MIFNQEKEKDKDFCAQLQKEKKSYEEQLEKLEFEVCNFCLILILMSTHCFMVKYVLASKFFSAQ